MRLLSFAHEGRPTFGAVVHPDPDDRDGDDRVVDLGGRLDGVSDLNDLLTQGRLDDARRRGRTMRRDRPGRRCRCRRSRSSARSRGPARSSASASTTAVATPSTATVRRRRRSRACSSASRVRSSATNRTSCGHRRASNSTTRARSWRSSARPAGASPRSVPAQHIAGLTLGNEGTIRDWVRHAKFNVTQGKNWESSGSLGPWMVTLDEIGGFDDLHLTTPAATGVGRRGHRRLQLYRRHVARRPRRREEERAGTARQRLSGVVDPSNSPEKIQQNMNNVVTQIFDNHPPKAKS